MKKLNNNNVIKKYIYQLNLDLKRGLLQFTTLHLISQMPSYAHEIKDGILNMTRGNFDIDKKDHNSAAKPKEIQEADNLADKLLADFGKNNWNQNYIKVCSGNGIQLLIKLDKPIIMPIIEQFEMDKDNRLLDVVVETDEFIKLKKALIFSFEDIFSKFKSASFSFELLKHL